MVKLNKIYTRTGDNGSTGLTDGSRVAKHSPRPQAYGSVDELNSSLGLVYLCLNNNNTDNKRIEIKNLIKEIQNDLFDLGADLSTPISKSISIISLFPYIHAFEKIEIFSESVLSMYTPVLINNLKSS